MSDPHAPIANLMRGCAGGRLSGNVTALRLTLIDRGYTPVPLHGKIPPLKTWQLLEDVTREQVEMWAKSWPDAGNTGALTRLMPTLDLDVLLAEAVDAVVLHVRERFEERGYVPARVGKAPKTALVFRTLAPFTKITANLTAPNGDASQKIELWPMANKSWSTACTPTPASRTLGRAAPRSK